MMPREYVRSIFLATAIGLVAASSSYAQSSAPADCAKAFSYNKNNPYEADTEAIKECVRRGGSIPKELKRESGRKPAKGAGAGGFSYGTVQAPENPPGKVGANASVTREVIQSSCTFPPRVKIGIPPSVSFPPGSCLDFFKGLFKDKNGNKVSNTSIPGVSPNDTCPEENDMTGMYGVKQSIASGGGAVRSCGGMVPLTTTDVVLNANSTELAATENGSYYIWINRRNPPTSTYQPVVPATPLPTYLCSKRYAANGDEYWQKSVDLTPPVGQMITYDKNVGRISIRLQSRKNIDGGFTPVYVEGETEKYLIIPIDGSGTPDIPKDCADESVYFQPLNSRQDIQIHAANNAYCNSPMTAGVYYNTPTFSYDSTGAPIKGTLVNHWSRSCVDGSTANPCPSTGAGTACDSSGGISSNCDVVTLNLTDNVCFSKAQYAVLSRPNLYYPAGSVSNIWPIIGRTSLMADTVAGSQIYTQRLTQFTLQPTAPTLKINEGGYLTLAGGQTLMMNAPATINVATRTITLPNGGQRNSASAGMLETIAPGTNYVVPSDLWVMPITATVERSVTLPAGFSIPTAPKMGSINPYIWLPVE